MLPESSPNWQWLEGQIGVTVHSVQVEMFFAEATLYQCTVRMGDGREIHAIDTTLSSVVDQCAAQARTQ